MLSTIQIGDFGCGKTKIMEAFGPERVYSFDHVAELLFYKPLCFGKLGK